MVDSYLHVPQHLLSQAVRKEQITFSKDIVVLIGALKDQVPHVDLFPGQFQAIVVLTPSVPTKVYAHEQFSDTTQSKERAGSQVTTAAFDRLQLDINSTSRFAKVLRFAPALSHSKTYIEERMRHVYDDLSQPKITL